MLKKNKKIQRIVEVAKLYYINDMTQNEIAKHLNISRPLVSKLLNDAKEAGIVTINIKPIEQDNSFYLERLKEEFGIKEALITQQFASTSLTDKNMIDELPGFLKKITPATSNIGIGWGNMIGNFINKIKKEDNFLEIKGKSIPLIGNLSLSTSDFHSNELVRIFGEKTGLNPFYFFAPAFVTTKTEKEVITNLENYQKLLHLWGKLDIILVDITNHPSVPDLATAFRYGKKLNDKKAVGKILSHFYDIDGNIIESDEDFSTQIPLELIKNTKKVVGIVSSKTSRKALLGALKTGLFTHLVLSENSIEDIIND